ncbi:MAG: hypothetical protein H6574_12765 [Lewinellaceae bacterium]|nr:hypothetical protein [Saprospiraceae bacterium]MCB9331945.1 hypothetical protein [Lewinellaceae bacterium]
MLDEILPFAIAMFVLSQISERISNFLKLYLPKKWFGNLDLRDPNPAKEKARERKIMALSLVAGALTTLLFYFSYLIPAEKASEQPEWVCYMDGITLVYRSVAHRFFSEFRFQILA